MKLKEFFLELCKDEKGIISIKPVTAIIIVLFLCTSLLISALSKRVITPSDSIIDALMWICMVAIGGDVADKFSVKKNI